MLRRGTVYLFVIVVVIVGWIAPACGGSDDQDFGDIRETATAVAVRTPSPAPTTDPLPAYFTQASLLAKELGDLVNVLDTDMLAAAQSQADPKWPQVLTADADLVIAKAQALRRLPVPGGVPQALSGKITQAVDGLTAGAELLKQAILKLDPAIGAQSATTLADAEKLLDEVRLELGAATGR